jgi:hypothetical protein
VSFAEVLDLAAASGGEGAPHVYLAQAPLLEPGADEPAPLAPLLADLPDTPELVVRCTPRACSCGVR